LSKVAFLFPGQGAQTVGMGRIAAAEIPAVADLFARANSVLGYALDDICFNGPASRLDSTIYSQPALFVCGLAGLELLRQGQQELLDRCEAAAGLSLGEYTAMVFAGVMDFETGLRVVQRRGEAMQAASDAAPSGMVSLLGLEVAAIEKLCAEASQGEVLQIANYLCPGNIVVSGAKGACERVAELAVAAGAMKAIPLAVAGAFHTPLMQSAVQQLAEVLATVELQPPRIPVISNVDARPHCDPEEIRHLLVQQVVSPVRWEASIQYLLEQRFDSFYEIGPGRVLRSLMKRISRQTFCENISV